MTGVREPAVAGMFYPAEPDRLESLVDALVDAVAVPPDEPLAPAYVVPHAGYRFSGPTAAHVYARLRRHADAVRRVVLIGPSHRFPLSGCAGVAASAWRTPLGLVTVDRPEQVPWDDAPHRTEHSLEVQLPFLQRVLAPDVTVMPIAVGRSTVDEAAEAIADADVVLCSTDLSHYLTQEQARRRDDSTAARILALEPETLRPEDACGVFALRGLLGWARRQGLRPRVLQLATSADTAGSPDRVVGYPAFAFDRR